MKSVFLIVSLLTSLSTEARETKIVILREPAMTTELTGFTESLYAKHSGKHVKSCFSGAANQVCTEVKTSIKRANRDLAQAGAAQRFDIVTCAQNPNRAMVIVSTRTDKSNKTVFIDRCADETQEVVLTLSN